MAEGQVNQMLENEVTCPLCLDIFKEPKKLPCDHVYCKECLRGLALIRLNETISCPECRTPTQVPGNDVNNFPTDFRVNSLLEVFQQAPVQVETADPLNGTEMCQVHPAQPLAIYCETCKKQLCQDCVKEEHASHEWNYFEKMVPKYREKIVGEKSFINNVRKPSISTALEKIATVKSSIAGHEQKCQDDIEHTFEQMISVLQNCKQAMKDEATAYYSSITGVFDQQKERLKVVLHQAESAVTSIDANLQDDGHNFFERLKSTFERIDCLEKELQTLSLTVAQPRPIAIQAADVSSLEQYVKQNYFFCELAQAGTCICSFDDSVKLYYNEKTLFTLTLRNSRGTVYECQDRVNRVDIALVNVQGNSTKGDTQPLSQGQVKILLTPTRRGLHKLNVKVNGAHIKNSPFTVTVHMPPNLLLKPVATMTGMERPASLVYSQAEDMVVATIMDEGVIRKVDSQFQLIPSTFVVLPRVNEITEDAKLNIFYVTTLNDNKVHKLSNSGRIIKSVGQTGTEIVEFNYPNGLRVSKKRELYVCDSKNNRVQIFDLNLNFLRSFGERGYGKGQFNFPADVDFDASGNIYIVDTNNHRIQVFTCDENHIRTMVPNDPDINPISIPVSLIIHDENMYVTDRYNHKVWVRSTSGNFITTFGDGILREPEGITMDKAGFIYVTSAKREIVVF